MSELTVDLHEHVEFVKERLAALSARLRSSIRPRTHHTDECPDCLQDAAVIIGDRLKCLFCGHEIRIRQYAELISTDRSVETCPECSRESVALHSSSETRADV